MAERGEIENGKTPMSEGDAAFRIDPRATVIRTTQDNGIRHPRDFGSHLIR
jgi:hypothetical protein